MADFEGLDALRDIHLPSDVGWWPPAPGWWVVGVLALLLLVAIWIIVSRCRERGRPRREALRALLDTEKEWLETGDGALACVRVSALLRKYVMARLGREHVAGLAGDAWLQCLNEAGEGVSFDAVREALLVWPWCANPKVDPAPLMACTRAFLGKQKTRRRHV